MVVAPQAAADVSSAVQRTVDEIHDQLPSMQMVDRDGERIVDGHSQ